MEIIGLLATSKMQQVEGASAELTESKDKCGYCWDESGKLESFKLCKCMARSSVYHRECLSAYMEKCISSEGFDFKCRICADTFKFTTEERDTRSSLIIFFSHVAFYSGFCALLYAYLNLLTSANNKSPIFIDIWIQAKIFYASLAVVLTIYGKGTYCRVFTITCSILADICSIFYYTIISYTRAILDATEHFTQERIAEEGMFITLFIWCLIRACIVFPLPTFLLVRCIERMKSYMFPLTKVIKFKTLDEKPFVISSVSK